MYVLYANVCILYICVGTYYIFMYVVRMKNCWAYIHEILYFYDSLSSLKFFQFQSISYSIKDKLLED